MAQALSRFHQPKFLQPLTGGFLKMSQHRLSRNMQFRLRGREFIIEKRLPDGRIRIKDIITDERSALPEQELVEAVFENNAELLGRSEERRVGKECRSR